MKNKFPWMLSLFLFLGFTDNLAFANLESDRQTMADLVTRQSLILCAGNAQRILQIKDRVDALYAEARRYYDARPVFLSDQQMYTTLHNEFVARYDALNAALDRINDSTREFDVRWASGQNFSYTEDESVVEPDAQAMVAALNGFLTAMQNFHVAGRVLYNFYLNPITDDFDPNILNPLEDVHRSQFFLDRYMDIVRVQASGIATDQQLHLSTLQLWNEIRQFRGRNPWLRGEMTNARNFSQAMLTALSELIETLEHRDGDLNEDGDNLTREAQALFEDGDNTCHYSIYMRYKMADPEALRRFLQPRPVAHRAQ